VRFANVLAMVAFLTETVVGKVKRQEEEREQRSDGQHRVVFHGKVSLLDFMCASLPCCLCLWPKRTSPIGIVAPLGRGAD